MGERLKNPYACSICFKTFSVSLHLVNHVEFKHLSPNQPLIKVEPKDQDYDEEQCINIDENKVKIEMIDNSVDEQVDMEADNDLDDKYLSQNETVQTQIKTDKNHHGSKHQKFKINLKDITLFKNHSFVKIKRLSERQIRDWTQKKQSSIKSYDCSYCDKKFPKAHFAKIHERIHLSEKPCEKPYSCKYCGKKFTQLGSVKVHERIHTGEKPFATTNLPNLKKQEQIHKDTDINVRANEKFDKFHEPDNLTEIKENSLKKQTKTLVLETHRQERTVENQAVNYLEGHKNSDDRNQTNFHKDIGVNLNKASINKNSNGKYGCRFCDKEFTQSGSARRHEKTHSRGNGKASTTKYGNGKFGCRFCDKEFTQSGWAKRHEETHKETHKDTDINVSENESFKTFNEPENSIEVKDNSKSEQENSLDLMDDTDINEPSIENMKDVTVENPVSVQEAVKYFEGNKTIGDVIETSNIPEDIAVNLNRAPITKNSDGKYGCRFCDFKSNLKFSVQRHERTHTGKKPFACRYCPYTNSSGNMKKHEESHKIPSEDKSTDKSSKMYSSEPTQTKSNLIIEENHGSDQGETDSHFKCELCLDYVQNESRHLHIVQCKLYTKYVQKILKGFKCQICSKELTGKVAMLDHLKSSHPNLAKFFQPPNINKTRQTNDDSDEVSVSPGFYADTFSLPGKDLDLSMKSQIVNVKKEILQQSFENVLSSDQIWNSSNINANVQKDILGRLSILEPVAFEKAKDLNQMEEFPMNESTESIENNVQTTNFGDFDGQSSYSKVVANQKNLKKPKRKPGSCRFCGKTFTRKAHALRHEETHKKVAMIELMPGQKTSQKPIELNRKSTNYWAMIPDQTNAPIDTKISKYDCKYCDMKFTQKGSAKSHEETYHTEGGFVQNLQKSLQHNNASSEIMNMDVPKFDRSQFLSESEESSLSSSFQSFVTNYQPEIQQESLIKKELIQMNDQISDSSKNEEKDYSKFQNDILRQLSILDPIPFEKSKENNRSNVDSDVQNDILGQLSKLQPVVFEESKELNRRSNAVEKPFGCEYCDKRFKFYLIARHHEKTHTSRTHTGEKPFGCGYCEMKFTRLRSATEHERTHTGEKPYGCKYCDKKFTASQSAKSHERTHTGEKPYACKYCEKKFSHLSSLKSHETIHTGEKSFCCKICDYKAATHTSLKKHETTHNQGNIDYNAIHVLSNSVFERSNPLTT